MNCFLVTIFMALYSVTAIGQQKSVSGAVISEDGMPIAGVNILQKGTSNGAVTDFDGNYNLTLKQGSDILVFSYVGYTTVEQAIGGDSTMNITLLENSENLDEVVIVGYGTQKKVNITGAVGMVNGDVLEDRPIATVGQGLQGVVAGLNITVQNGDPSQSVAFNIRGLESINGGSPLILVDNIPMDINSLNPEDIESISVLKDAAASAVYGARAAFGVVLVTTKKGKQGKVQVTLSTELSTATPIFHLNPVNDPYTFVTAWNEAAVNAGGQPAYDQNYIEGTKRWSENPTQENEWGVYNDELRFYGFNDYQKQIVTNSSPQQKFNLGISGATEKTSIYASFGYFGKEGFLANEEKNQKFQRYNALISAEIKVNKWIKLSERMVYINQSDDSPQGYSFDAGLNSVARMSPIAALDFPDLPYYLTPGDHDQYEQYIGMDFGDSYSSLPYIEQGGRQTWTNQNLVLTQGVELTLAEGFAVKGDFSYNVAFRTQQNVKSRIQLLENRNLSSLIIGNGYSANDYIQNRTNYSQYFTTNVYAEYEYDKLENNYFKMMVGYNQENGKTQQVLARANNLITPGITDLDATTGEQFTGGGQAHYALRGMFFRFNYNFKEKYFLEVNGRYDGTSRFPSDDRFGFFPSVSAGWRISKEPFMESTEDWLDNLKIRASYGQLGNQVIQNSDGSQNYYPYIASMSASSSDYIMNSGQTPMIQAAGLVSPTLTWETVATTNFGLDVDMLQNKLNFSLDLYQRDTYDMLLGVSKPAILGASAPQENGADLRTRGWEFSASWRDQINQDWKYGVTVALSDNQTEITKYDNPTGNYTNYYVGKKIGEIWGLETAGIFQTNEEVANSPSQTQINSGVWQAGDMKYADLNGDGVIDRGDQTLDNPGDMKIIGNSTPRYSFGINGNIAYKSFSLDMFFQGLTRDYLPPNTPWAAFYPYNTGYVDQYFLTETWSPENPDAYFSRPMVSTENNKNIVSQSRFVQNASYIRLKNLTLNYNLSQDLVEKIGLTKVSVYVAGQNLWEASSIHEPLDPENTYTSLNQQYYFDRTYSLGLKVSF
ncbi:TonB-dependent receptor [Formosa sp. PL04]|uniref:SusC/RagA family TonB-linked outer membrane protein n=1 Tax=Formosa sp. PL04 TaxID=3081755 RepID=UPI002981233A|nr:TonB-dependent receptor [Formosa sp. PL04]MDW5288131.1 TonB-dependent receptor [Formosa sp. PL04]